MPARYRLANEALKVPMPDRNGRLFAGGDEGEAVDAEDPFYRALINDGDLVPVENAEAPDPLTAKPDKTPAAPDGGQRKGK